jgi:hypothetical protein
LHHNRRPKETPKPQSAARSFAPLTRSPRKLLTFLPKAGQEVSRSQATWEIRAKAVLILGRFTPKRKAVLDALREELRGRGYLPILFDFDKPAGKDLTGTVQTLANMARFVIADLTDPSSVPHELAMVVPGTVVPVQPVLPEGQPEYAMFVDLKRRYHWVLKPYRYASPEQLMADLGERVVGPAEEKVRELRAAP